MNCLILLGSSGNRHPYHPLVFIKQVLIIRKSEKSFFLHYHRNISKVLRYFRRAFFVVFIAALQQPYNNAVQAGIFLKASSKENAGKGCAGLRCFLLS
jgi:hypothetical protein